MFTGIVQEMGTVERLTPSGDSLELWVALPRLAQQAKRGDSIAINGVCLTVTTLSDKTVRFDVMRETVNHSMLKALRPGQRVNAEPALRAGDSMGGHWVQGHVDGTGQIKSIQPAQGYTLIIVEAPDTVTRYCVPKGSITLSGVSLTLVEVAPTTLSVSIIPTTLTDTIIGQLKGGDEVNLEVDILGKYVYHYLAPKGAAVNTTGSQLSEEFLKSHGF